MAAALRKAYGERRAALEDFEYAKNDFIAEAFAAMRRTGICMRRVVEEMLEVDPFAFSNEDLHAAAAAIRRDLRATFH